MLWVSPCAAVVDNAPPATGWAARPIVMVVDARGDLCTGTALTRDLVLTAAHCVTRPVKYEVKAFQNGIAYSAISANGLSRQMATLWICVTDCLTIDTIAFTQPPGKISCRSKSDAASSSPKNAKNKRGAAPGGPCAA
jgi:hypothetical protein